MIGVTLVVLGAALRLLPLHAARPGDARGRAEPGIGRLVGIRVGWMLALGWGLAAAIGAVAGMMVAPVVFLEPNMMAGILLYAFAGALLGGIDSPGGAVLGGFSSACSRTSSAPTCLHRQRAEADVALVIIVVVLIVQPERPVRPRRS